MNGGKNYNNNNNNNNFFYSGAAAPPRLFIPVSHRLVDHTSYFCSSTTFRSRVERLNQPYFENHDGWGIEHQRLGGVVVSVPPLQFRWWMYWWYSPSTS
mmetsp:Transcript_29656/g.71780  ORF Transcript_29656/g.71780 Transcript_29656/m.71780 type:complete len:99 (+) Transcript_29656:772-1068(+)